MTYKLESIKDEENDFYSDDDLFKISYWGADLSFREIIQRYQDNELVKPELQRKYVWDKTEASRFIDSLLLGLPVPSIFLAKTIDEKLLIIDGYQRIMTVYDYVRGIFTGDNKVFKLSRSEKINIKWRGKAFNELTDSEQRKVRNTTIHAIIFLQQQQSGEDTSLFQVFERINTSGRTLLPQEIRNCVYQGNFNNLLFELNKLPNWRKLFGSNEEDQRMRDIELILRFFALNSAEFESIQQENISLKKFLNQFIGKFKNLTDEQLANFKNRFTNCIDFIYHNIGENAFNNISSTTPGKFSPNFSPTIFDSISIATDQLLQSKFKFQTAEIQKHRNMLLHDEEYKFYISKETMRRESIEKRIQKVKSILYNVK
jgi:uncharacterized protein with ParB-like and HNH nuclease domain